MLDSTRKERWRTDRVRIVDHDLVDTPYVSNSNPSYSVSVARFKANAASAHPFDTHAVNSRIDLSHPPTGNNHESPR